MRTISGPNLEIGLTGGIAGRLAEVNYGYVVRVARKCIFYKKG